MAQGSGIAFVPRLPAKLIDRQRLIDRVEHASRAPIVIVRAPAGGGKSTVLASWAEHYPRPGVWVRVDRSSGTRFPFWQRVADSIVDAGIVGPDSVLARLLVTGGIADQLRPLLQRGLSEAGSTTIILDDFHEVSDESILDDVLWLAESSTPVSFVIATRTAGGWEDPARIARVDTGILRPSDLAFDREEVAAVARLFDAADAAAEVHRAFAGWPLPTRAALLQLEGDHTLPLHAAIDRVRVVGDSFVVDLLDGSGYGDFLLRTSVAHRMSRELAREIGGPNADAHLSRAERDGLGTWSSGARRDEFMLHPYLRERLESEFAERLPGDVEAARRAYARERLERDDPSEAARQYIALGDLDSVVDVVRAFHGELLSSHAYATLLAGIDERDLRHHPELLVVRMLVAYADPTVKRPTLLQGANLAAAMAYARLGGGKPVERTSLLLSLLAAQRLGGHYDHAAKTADQVATALEHLGEARLEELRGMLPAAWTHIATTLLYDDRPALALQHLSRAKDAAERWSAPWTHVHASGLEELVLAVRGDLRQLIPRLEATRERSVPAGWPGTYAAAGHHLAEAYAALERFEHRRAKEHVDALAAHEPTIEHWPLLARLRSLCALVDGTPYIGLQALSASITAHQDRPPTSRAMTTLLATTRADLLLFAGQPHRALDALRPSRREASARVVHARIHLSLGDYTSAVKEASAVAWSDESMPRAKAEALLLIAVASLRLNQLGDARDAADRALGVLDSFGLRWPLMMIPRDDLATVLDAIGASTEDLLRDVPDRFSTTTRDWALTAAERRVVALLERTGSVDELSASLGVSANTTKTHLRQVYRKLGVRSRAEALATVELYGLADEQGGDARDG